VGGRVPRGKRRYTSPRRCTFKSAKPPGGNALPDADAMELGKGSVWWTTNVFPDSGLTTGMAGRRGMSRNGRFADIPSPRRNQVQPVIVPRSSSTARTPYECASRTGSGPACPRMNEPPSWCVRSVTGPAPHQRRGRHPVGRDTLADDYRRLVPRLHPHRPAGPDRTGSHTIHRTLRIIITPGDRLQVNSCTVWGEVCRSRR
jgi:hypothetical protein